MVGRVIQYSRCSYIGTATLKMDVKKQDHHEQKELCVTRPCYRDGKKQTAVKVYTVCDESTHLLVSKVPSINLHVEVCALCNRFGKVTNCTLVPGYQSKEEFEETFHVQYSRIQAARYAKKHIDGREFYGGHLHVCYAPELESVDETRLKLVQRRKEIAARTKRKAGPIDRSSDVPSKLGKPAMLPVKYDKKYIQPCKQTRSNSTDTGNQMQNINICNAVIPEFQGLHPMECNQSITVHSSSESITGKSSMPLAVNHQDNSSSLSLPTLLRFVPRSVSIKKQIVFHKKQNPP